MTRNAMTVKVGSNSAALAAAFGDLGRRQIPFASSRAINKMLTDSQKRERRRMERVFKIRSKWVVNQLHISRSNKRQRPIRGAVGHTQKWMADHETGKVRRKPGQRQAIPTRLIRRTTRPPGVRRSELPRELISRGKARKVEVSAKTGLVVGNVSKRRTKVKHLGQRATFWILKRRVRIRPRWRFRKSVERRVARTYDRVFREELLIATLSAKRKGGASLSLANAERLVRGG